MFDSVTTPIRETCSNNFIRISQPTSSCILSNNSCIYASPWTYKTVKIQHRPKIFIARERISTFSCYRHSVAIASAMIMAKLLFRGADEVWLSPPVSLFFLFFEACGISFMRPSEAFREKESIRPVTVRNEVIRPLILLCHMVNGISENPLNHSTWMLPLRFFLPKLPLDKIHLISKSFVSINK